MKILYKKKLYCVGLLVLLMNFASCENNEKYDFEGDSMNRIFLRNTENSFKVVHTAIGSISKVNYKAPVFSAQKANAAVKATVAVDNSYIDKYNAVNGTNYSAIPVDAIDLGNELLTIPENGMISSDSLNVKLKDSYLDKLTETAYVIPLRISEVVGGNAAASTNMNVAYIVVTTETNNINDSATEGDIRGSLVSERSAWSAISTPANSTTARLFDGVNTTNFSLSSYTTSNADLSLVIDMAQTYQVAGLYLNYRGNAASSYMSGVSVYVSKDNVTWKEVGKLTATKVYTVFYGSYEGRYIKLVKKAQPYYSSYYYTTMYLSEFNIYAEQ
ncbi:BT_3987 domain-containing protein [Bacteroides ihuae]|uniref:BT_3987 domain-containing protein n=1 Tax=Bacteroides ihuae TaxID=1852362 RepID=UPI0008D9D240|nr:DUF1735 domain-containing protein [Bacteroides ihuae]